MLPPIERVVFAIIGRLSPAADREWIVGDVVENSSACARARPDSCGHG
jgi:hypothetical protein